MSNESPTQNKQNEGLTNSLLSLARPLFHFLVFDIHIYVIYRFMTRYCFDVRMRTMVYGIINIVFIIVTGLNSKSVISTQFLVLHGGEHNVPTYY